ncbi:serine/threonine-protein kinase [Streptomyces formicae]|uniref:non-specific serine/threonine protein kinase n=1 Tax=Streptomyces formicae TaxID=1616117 RepID=A0ABY3WMG0_9ACTN|nr:serine/threonine-protein kinase [Streptomyces formicae]UNM13330.1 serine/threonine protein kinase [Streptomyces formicae]
MNAWSVPGYTESRELGSGGSGRVVLAVHDATGTPVAVKYLGERLRRDAAFVREFRFEARLLGGLDTPHVVQLYEYVEAPEGAAIVMELVDGVALRALLAREGRTGPEPALVVLKGSLLGLAAAHRAGVVHRDYKPENVLVAADGSSKLADFGIAARRGTTPGVAGTPAYMAPEQWSGEPASPAADVYAATATFFECLTGRKPFPGQNIAELAFQHTTAPVPVEDVPEEMRPLVLSGLAKSPGERPANAEAFVAELEQVALAAYGPGWEERGQRGLAALAALLPLLFPSAGGAPPAGIAARAATSLGRGHRLDGHRPGGQGLLAGALALVLGLVLVLTARAGDEAPGRAAAEAVATTSAVPGTGTTAAPGAASASPAPPASSSPSASTSTPEPTPTPTPTPTPEATGPSTPGAPSAPPSVTLTAPPPVTSEPPVTPEPPAPVSIVSVSVASLRQTGTSTAAATVDVVTDGTGPVTIVLNWATGEAKGGPGTADGTDTSERRGATRYRLAVDHTFQGRGCYWSLRADTTPAAANGGSRQEILTRRCTVT